MGDFECVFLSVDSCHIWFWSSERTGSSLGHLVNILFRMFYGVDFDGDLYGIRLIESRIREYISENVQRTCVYFGDTEEMEMIDNKGKQSIGNTVFPNVFMINVLF